MFDATTRPAEHLFYTRDDPNDRRLGDVVRFDPDHYAAADTVLLGLPYDEGVRRNQGRPGAADAPEAIRRQLYKLSAARFTDTTLFDLGDTDPQATLEATHNAHQQVVEQVLADGKRLIVLGGGNDTAYPDCAALATVAPEVMAINIDAHFDVREAEKANSGTPYRQLLDANHVAPERFYEVGYQPFANSPVYTDYLIDLGAAMYSLQQVNQLGADAVMRSILGGRSTSVFLGLDMDSIQASDAPGVSAPSPVGLTAPQMLEMVTLAAEDPRLRIFEITEVNPAYDVDGWTAKLAALAVWHVLEAIERL